MKKTIKYSIIDSLSTAVYIALVVLVLYSLNHSSTGIKQTILIPILMLTLFVFSAALTGSLVLGRPILWYLDGKKKEAVNLFVYTLWILLLIILFLLVIIFVI